MNSKETMKAHGECCTAFVKFLDVAASEELQEYQGLINNFLRYCEEGNRETFWEAVFEFSYYHHADHMETTKERKNIAKNAALLATSVSNEEVAFLNDILKYTGIRDESVMERAWAWLHEEREKPKFEIVSRSEPTEPRTEEQPPSESGQPVLVGAPEPA